MTRRRTEDDFRAEQDAKKQVKGETLLALNNERALQEHDVSNIGTNAPSISDAVVEINQLLNQADATRLDAGRRLLALRARVEAGEVGSEVKWWEFYAKHFTRSRKDAEKLMRLAQSDDPNAAIEAEKRAQKIRDDRKRQRGAGPAPSAAAELIHEQQLRMVERNADFGRGRGDDTGFPDGGSEGDGATGGHGDPSDPGRGDPDDLGSDGDPAGHDDHSDQGDGDPAGHDDHGDQGDVDDAPADEEQPDDECNEADSSEADEPIKPGIDAAVTKAIDALVAAVRGKSDLQIARIRDEVVDRLVDAMPGDGTLRAHWRALEAANRSRGAQRAAATRKRRQQAAAAVTPEDAGDLPEVPIEPISTTPVAAAVTPEDAGDLPEVPIEPISTTPVAAAVAPGDPGPMPDFLLRKNGNTN